MDEYQGRQNKEPRSKGKQVHELNRTLSNLGREFGEIRANLDKIEKVDTL